MKLAHNDIYIASAWLNRDMIKREIVPALDQVGIRVTSRWLTVPDAEIAREDKHLGNRAWMSRCDQMARYDLEDIDKARIVVFLADDYKSTGGMFVELGYAIAKGKIIVWVSKDIPNVFVIRAGYFCTLTHEEAQTARDGRRPFLEVLCELTGKQLTKLQNMSTVEARRLMNKGTPSGNAV